jgi:hypothetical protein
MNFRLRHNTSLFCPAQHRPPGHKHSLTVSRSTSLAIKHCCDSQGRGWQEPPGNPRGNPAVAPTTPQRLAGTANSCPAPAHPPMSLLGGRHLSGTCHLPAALRHHRPRYPQYNRGHGQLMKMCSGGARPGGGRRGGGGGGGGRLSTPADMGNL